MADYSRLTYPELKRFVGFLSDTTLAELAKGPLPDEGLNRTDTCRVCAVLEPLKSSGPANVLLEWHDLVSRSFRLLSDIIERPYANPDIEDALIDDMQQLVGACSYARCCAVYAAAEAELNRRRYVACAEPSDERDELEKRRDGEAEDAERRLDAEKAGDL